MQGLKIFLVILFGFSAQAAEVVNFPSSKTQKRRCFAFLNSQLSNKNSATIINLDSYRSEFMSMQNFLTSYPLGSAVFVFTPKDLSAYSPVFSRSNFNLWRPLDSEVQLDPKQDHYVLLGLTKRNSFAEAEASANSIGSSITAPSPLVSRSALNRIDYQTWIQEYTPAHHTTFTVAPIYRLALTTIEHLRSLNAYLNSENLSQTEPLQINYSIIFYHKNHKYGARDFVSSWATKNSHERDLQEFLIRFIDLEVRHNEDIFYGKKFIEITINEMREKFKNSQEALSSLATLEGELSAVLKLSPIAQFE